MWPPAFFTSLFHESLLGPVYLRVGFFLLPALVLFSDVYAFATSFLLILPRGAFLHDLVISGFPVIFKVVAGSFQGRTYQWGDFTPEQGLANRSPWVNSHPLLVFVWC